MQLLYTKRKCRNHGFLLAFFGDFLSLLKESHPSETKEERAAGGTFLTQKGLLKESHPPEAIEEGIPSGRKHKIPQKRIDISLIPAII